VSKKNKETETPVEEILEEQEQQTAEEQAQPEAEAAPEAAAEQPAEQDDKYLRLAAEYDNYRKRTAKEKESIWTTAKADTAAAFLPVYDNLERAIKQETADEAYKKGVEMTMSGLMTIMESLGVKAFGEVGETFDPVYHNAVMHKDDENFGESIICEVFQTGFKVGEKVVRHAMVVVAN